MGGELGELRGGGRLGAGLEPPGEHPVHWAVQPGRLLHHQAGYQRIQCLWFEWLYKELGIENVPGEEIEMPFQFGFFYKYCGKEEWKDTGVKSTSLICCQVSKEVTM